LTQQQEEHDFLNEICLAALSADKKSVRFAVVVGDNGKLLAGEYTRNRFFENNYDSVIIKSSIFYLYYLIAATKNQQQKSETGCSCYSSSYDSSHDNMFYSRLEDLGNNTYLVVTALTEKR
jgi:hypothetical protein